MRIAVVTGAGSGIGRAVSLALAAKGYGIVLAGRRSSTLQSVADESAALGGTPLPIQADVTDAGAVRALFDAAVLRFSRVDLLFNNAGLNMPPTPIHEITLDSWNSIVGVNLTGAFLCIQAAFEVMKNQTPRGGRIINNGSISAYSPRPDSFAYTASKHAVTGLTKCASLDGRRYDIACGQIDIGNAATDMVAAMTAGIRQADDSIREEPVMNVATVGDAVVYMDSLPLEANVQFMTVMATKMPFVGRG